MSIEETRQLGIEFERRVQTIDPTTEIIGKMSTDDIYSYLNQYQLQYIKSLYISDGQAESQSRQSYKIQDTLKSILQHSITLTDRQESTYDNKAVLFSLPRDYFSYVRSTSTITGSYKNKSVHGTAQNVMLKQDDVHKILESVYDQHSILRNPICTVIGSGDPDNSKLEVIHDEYTTINSVDLVYIKRPADFKITGSKQIKCELPKECFEDLVTGAVELYFNYKYKVTLASSAARRKAAREELGTDKQNNQQEA